ncbi:MAG: flagellar hook protein FlgE [Pseudomonas sp.]|uniref:flagellar hook protein FlgE n=1 Tax=Pseudomonas sp. TaxID=306 RepID=UPI003391AC10
MAFNIGLSGLRAATNDLNVTGNNIANAGTAGFKQSRAEFADVYAASVMGTGKNAQGSGVLLGDVSQLFNQGNINYTQNALDLAINGNGFFVTSNNGEIGYTRAGYFGTDKEGFIVNNFNQRLQGYSVDANDNLQNGIVGDLKIQTASQAPNPTSKIEQTFNLNSTNLAPTTTPFNPADPTTYNSSTSVNIYDAEGNSHAFTQYFVKTGPNAWDMNVLIDGRNPDDPTLTTPSTVDLVFTEAGRLDVAALIASAPTGFTVDASGVIQMANWVPAAPNNAVPPVWSANGAAPNLPDGTALDLRKSTQFANAFSVNKVTQDGYTTGELAGLEIDDAGLVFARYTNGQSKVQGQVILASFANMQGLTPIGKTGWAQSSESGEPIIGTPRSGTLGALQSGALEDSNVELSDQLVNLIVAQRNYQANAKTIETESAITQTIINLR